MQHVKFMRYPPPKLLLTCTLSLHSYIYYNPKVPSLLEHYYSPGINQSFTFATILMDMDRSFPRKSCTNFVKFCSLLQQITVNSAADSPLNAELQHFFRRKVWCLWVSGLTSHSTLESSACRPSRPCGLFNGLAH